MRKKSFLLFALICSVLMLSGCGPIYQTHYSYIPPHSRHGRRCINRCLSDRSMCRGQCQTNQQSCQTNANLIAMPQYLSYVQQRNAANEPVNLSISDFADYSNCSDHCGCESTYRACFTNCGGSVLANTQCVAFCNQK
ncbi:MAG: hypothetical protein ACD_42C00458G0002 [uncultured bacterium]|nr:MAG: hypothetical protein ACD_42C00458G0002 [uncultured bacterium]